MKRCAGLPIILICGSLLTVACQSMPASPSQTIVALAPSSDPMVGRWRLESASTDNATVQGLGIKTSGFAQLEDNGTGKLDMIAKLGFLSRAKKSSFTWRRDGKDLLVQEEGRPNPTRWTILSSSPNRMEAEVPSGNQKVRMVFIRE